MINLDELNKALEPKRLKARNSALLVGGGLFLIIIVFISSMDLMFSIIPLFILLAIGLFAMIFILNSNSKKYAVEVKSIISQEIFAPQFENYSFNPEGEFPYQIIKELDILPRGDSYHSNDLMKGKLHDVSFTRADVHTTTTTTDSEGHSSTTTDFKGQVYSFDFFKNSNSYIRIRDRSFSKFGRGRKVDGSNQLKFEDEEFNKMFRCYTNNDHEAFYLFTPQFMQKLKDFRTKLNLHFSLVIHNSVLYIAIYTNKDSFEPSIFKPIDKKFLDSVNQDIGIITMIIDDLGLQNTLFK